MTQPFEFFDASGSGDAARHTSTSDVLGGLHRTGTEASLTRALDERNDLVEQLSATDRAEGVPPELASLLDTITGADGAPLAWASLHRRVHAGLTTWDSFWLDPTAEEDGMRLVTEVMRLSREHLDAGLAAARSATDPRG